MKQLAIFTTLLMMIFQLSAQIQVVEDISCNGDTNGTIMVVPGFGVAPYSYNWNNGATTQVIHNIGAGSYNVTVTDGTAATMVYNFDLPEPTQIVIAYAGSDISPSTCDGFNNGGADITVSGGVPGYTYQWNCTSFDSLYYTQDLANVRGGTYIIQVTDSWNCTVIDSLVIPNISVIPYVSTVESYVCNGLTGAVSVRANAAVPGYYFTYEWNTPFVTGNYVSNDTTFLGSVSLLAGTYTISITDNQTACMAYFDFTINQSATPLVVAATVNHNSCDRDLFGSITLGITGGDPKPAYNITWTGPNGYTASDIANITGLASGVYNYTVTDDSVCVVNSTVVVHSILGDCFTLPNMLTPNGDGYNDTYFVEGACDYTEFFIQIYDSWGKLVFESSDCNASWDPLGDNAPPNSVYYYLVRLNDGTNEKEYKSSIDIKY